MPSIIVAIALPLMVLVIAPLEIYCNNIQEFEFEVGHFLPWLSIAAFCVAVAIFGFLFLMPKTVYRIFYALAIGVLLMLFIQTNFLNLGMNSLAGDNLGNEISVGSKIVNTVIWVVVIAGILIATLLVKKVEWTKLICLVLSIALLATQLMSGFVLAISTDFEKSYGEERLAEDPNYTPMVLTTKNLTTLSKNKNIFIFCVDRFDGLEYAEPSMEKYPEIYSGLDGFTYFNDNTSLYCKTYPSVLYLITNEEFSYQSRDKVFNKAYSENKTISCLNDKGYDINIYVDDYYSYIDAYDMPKYVKNAVSIKNIETIISSRFALVKYMIQMSCYQSFPLLLKGIGVGIDSSTGNDLVEYDKKKLENEAYSTTMKGVWDYINANKFLQVDQNVFSFIHLEGCHSVAYDTNWNKVTNGNINDSISNSFKIINTYIQKMKEFGIYDDATIVITGDHPRSWTSTTALFVKPAKSLGINLDGTGAFNGGYNVSTIPTSHENLWATIFDSAQIEYDVSYGKSIFELSNENEVRRVIAFHENDTLTQTIELVYTITNSARDINNWVLTAKNTYDFGYYV